MCEPNGQEYEPFGPEIEARIDEIARQANRHNDNDWWKEAEDIARMAIVSALYDRGLIEQVLARRLYPPGGPPRIEQLETKTQPLLNIYRIGWVQSEQFGLNAVVIAASEEEALRELDLDSTYQAEVRISLMGVCTGGASKASVVCRESL